MKALSIKQPYISAILCGYKTEEIRGRNTNYRGKLLLCSTKKPEKPDENGDSYEMFPNGFALGYVDLVDVKYNEKYDDYEWVMINPVLIEPFANKGQQNFYEVDDKKIKPILENPTDDELLDYWYQCGFTDL